MIKTLTHPVTGQIVRMGRIRPEPEPAPRLYLRDYFLSANPAPAPDSNYTKRAQRALAQMYLNDRLGDCVIAGLGHFFGIANENIGGNLSIFDTAEIVNQYKLIGGYDPNAVLNPDGTNPTDNGCDEITAFNHVAKWGFAGHRFASGVTPLFVSGTDMEAIRQGIYLFENAMIGLELPDEWITPFPSQSGFTWDLAGSPDPNNGHFVVGCGANATGVLISTWAMVGTMTWAAIAEYAEKVNGGALYVGITKEILARATQKAPNGLDWAQLAADMAVL